MRPIEFPKTPNDTNESFDWCHPVPSDEGGWLERILFLVGAAILAALLGWQLGVLVHQFLDPERNGTHIGYLIVNVLVCVGTSVGLFLFHRVVNERRTLRRRLLQVEGHQEMSSALRKRNSELEVQSRTDFLTGVGNRRLFEETLEFETQRSDRYGDALSIALVEIGGLRRLHASLGRRAVDDVLKRTAALLQQTIENSDWLFRWSDGEFVVLWLNTDTTMAKAKSERLFNALSEESLVDSLDVPVSVGATTYCPQEGSDHLLARGDLAKKDLFKGGYRYLSHADAEAGSKPIKSNR